MFYLIGVAHSVQSRQVNGPESDPQKEFRDRLMRGIAEVKPVLVAEEFSEYALTKLTKETTVQHESVTKFVAESAKVSHRFCDPDAVARKKLGYVEGTQLALAIAMNNDAGLSNDEVNSRGFAIEVAKYWPLREQFWLAALKDVLDKVIIFVCGDGHADSFAELLKQKNIDSKVLARHIGVTQSDDEFWNRVLAYLKAHPELRD